MKPSPCPPTPPYFTSSKVRNFREISTDSRLNVSGLCGLKVNQFGAAEQSFQEAIMGDSRLPMTNFLLSVVHIHDKEWALSTDDIYYELDNDKNSDATIAQLGKVRKFTEISSCTPVVFS